MIEALLWESAYNESEARTEKMIVMQQMTIQSKKDCGTKITLRIPLEGNR